LTEHFTGRESTSMLSRETLKRYRRMTSGQRLALAFQLTDEATPYLFAGTPEQVRRRFELLRRENDERNQRILKGIARSMRKHEEH
jgi:hypothetical protein